MELNPTRKQIETMVEQLAQQPRLFARMEALLAQVRSEQVESLDDAEDAIVEQLRAIGREALGTWAREKAAEVAPPAGARRSVKKNSGA